MVPVQVVSGVSRLRREAGRSASQNSFSGGREEKPFDRVLQQKLSENEAFDGCVVTYGRDRQLRTCYYQPKREYTY